MTLSGLIEEGAALVGALSLTLAADFTGELAAFTGGLGGVLPLSCVPGRSVIWTEVLSAVIL